MKELIAHIENLLLTNDCVIVPNFGGFVTYRLPAKWVEEQNSFLPPVRTVGFNPRLQLNDGLLVQSYMSFYGTSFPDAHKRVLRGVKALKEKLYSEGKIDFASMGILRLSLDGSFHFTPCIDGVKSPELYGVAELHILPLKFEEEPAAETTPETAEKETEEIGFTPEPSAQPRRMHLRRIAGETFRWVSATAAAILLLLLFSAPVKNILPETAYKAQIVSSPFFSTEQTVSTPPVQQSPASAEKKPTQTPKAQPAKVEATSTAYKKKYAPKSRPAATTTPQQPAPKYFIVVASLSTSEKAEAFCQELKGKGYTAAQVIPGRTTQKVCIDGAADAEAARTLLRKYRETYEDAWLLTQDSHKEK